MYAPNTIKTKDGRIAHILKHLRYEAKKEIMEILPELSELVVNRYMLKHENELYYEASLLYSDLEEDNQLDLIDNLTEQMAHDQILGFVDEAEMYFALYAEEDEAEGNVAEDQDEVMAE